MRHWTHCGGDATSSRGANAGHIFDGVVATAFPNCMASRFVNTGNDDHLHDSDDFRLPLVGKRQVMIIVRPYDIVGAEQGVQEYTPHPEHGKIDGPSN